MRLAKTIPLVVKPSKFLRVLVPVDFTPASLNSLRCAGIRARRFGHTIHLLHVTETHPMAMSDGAMMLMKSDEESAREAKEQLSRLATKKLSAELPVRLLVRRGQPALEILRAAETLKADLLILTTHRHSVLGRVLLSSTVSRIERRAPCPVLVVRCDHDAGTDTALWRETDVDIDRLRPEPAT
jgi:universal stress protein F